MYTLSYIWMVLNHVGPRAASSMRVNHNLSRTDEGMFVDMYCETVQGNILLAISNSFSLFPFFSYILSFETPSSVSRIVGI